LFQSLNAFQRVRSTLQKYASDIRKGFERGDHLCGEIVEQRVVGRRRARGGEKPFDGVEIGLEVGGDTDRAALRGHAWATPSGHTFSFAFAQNLPRIACAAGGHIRKALFHFVDQKQMNALALQAVVIIEARGIDQCDVAFAIAGDDFFGAGFDFLGQVGKTGSGLRERDNVLGGDSHEASGLGFLELCTEFCI
jgi:hypothetical protein